MLVGEVVLSTDDSENSVKNNNLNASLHIYDLKDVRLMLHNLEYNTFNEDVMSLKTFVDISIEQVCRLAVKSSLTLTLNANLI